MTTPATDANCAFHRKLVALLEEKPGICPAAYALDFGDRLDALEIEALVACAPPSTLIMIRVARDAVLFAERIALRARSPQPAEAGQRL